LGREFDDLMVSEGVIVERNSPNILDQNGKPERYGRLLITKVRVMRIYSNLPEALFPEIYSTAAYIANRTLVKELGWKTLYEVVFGTPLLVYYLRVYGCWAYPLLKGPNVLLRKEKLQLRVYIGYLVGYDALNIFRVWIPSRNKVIRIRDIIFNK
jgi:hypothetical protein